ncbi:MAG: glucan 1,3-beta-glucosidase, partial [Olsenella sp.]|nr:glucan 1,3-beta-glucosidase [Olsenella sp.]
MTVPGHGDTLHGVNLDGWLVLESWVTPRIFAPSAALDEESLANRLGRDEYVRVVR